jgi:hypothetical protein
MPGLLITRRISVANERETTRDGRGGRGGDPSEDAPRPTSSSVSSAFLDENDDYSSEEDRYSEK